MGKTLINPKNQKTYGGDDQIPDENYYNGVFFSNPELAQMFRDNNWNTTLKVGDPEPEPETETPRGGAKKDGSKKKWHWIDDDRIPSQAEIDFYASFDEEGNPTEETTITQDHLDEIGMGGGDDGQGFTVDDVGPGVEVNADEIPKEMPGFTSEHNPYIDPMTGEKKFLTREQWSASIGEDEKYGKGRGFTAPEGGKVKSGTLRRNIRKMAPSLISGGRTA